MYAIIKPLGRSQSDHILSERGSVVYDGDFVHIYLHEYPTTIELKALYTIANATNEVIVLQIVKQ